MNNTLKLVLKGFLVVTAILSITIMVMIKIDVIWLPPKHYQPKEQLNLVPPVMTLEEYTVSGLIDSHPRPYVFMVESKINQGAVLVFGVEHTFDPDNKQFPVIKENWNKFNPTVALVEGDLDLIPKWLINGVKASGEGGYIQMMAKNKGIEIYSWEAGRDAEIEYCYSLFDPKEVTLFYALRRKHNKWSDYSKTFQDLLMKREISKNSKYPGAITSIAQVDSLWKTINPAEVSWRNYKHPRNGWPQGVLEGIAEASNAVRDINMCLSIIELVNKGERVFVTMGSSHAPRVEETLKGMIK